MKLPLGKGGAKGGDDLFDNMTEDLDNLGPENLDDLETYELGTDDRIRSLRGSGGWIKIAAIALTVLIGGGATGYWLVSGGGEDEAAPSGSISYDSADVEQFGLDAPAPAEAPAQTEQEPAPATEEPRPVAMAEPGDGMDFIPLPPRSSGPPKPEESLISPPTKDALAATDKSTSRRPWLQMTPGAAPDGNGALPGVVANPTGPVEPGEKISPLARMAEETPPEEAVIAEAPPEPVAEAPMPEPAMTEQAAETPAEMPVAEMPAEPPAATLQPPQNLPPLEAPAETPVETPPPEPAMTETPTTEQPAPQLAAATPAPAPTATASMSGGPQDPPGPADRSTDGKPPRPPLFRDLSKPPKGAPLPPAPIEGLTETTNMGPLPVIAEDGSRAWQAYARPFEAQQQGKIALIVTGLGLRSDATQAAIDLLPPQVTLSFSPYTKTLQQWIDTARQAGHEVLIELPMEPANFPARDPGPLGLLTLLSAEENISRLETALGKATGYVGVMAVMGERFLATPQYAGPVMNTLSKRGLVYVGNGTGIKPGAMAPMGLAYASSDVEIDAKMFRESIDARLRHLTVIAQTQGSAVGMLAAKPVSMMRVVEWMQGLTTAGIELAPVTAVVNQ